MRVPYVLLAMLTAAALGGCDNPAPTRMPWENKVPITKPQETVAVPSVPASSMGPISEADLIGPATQPAPAEERAADAPVQLAEPSALAPAQGATPPKSAAPDKSVPPDKPAAPGGPATPDIGPMGPLDTVGPSVRQPATPPVTVPDVQPDVATPAPASEPAPAPQSASQPAAKPPAGEFDISIDSFQEKPATRPAQPASKPKIDLEQSGPISTTPEMVAASALQVNDRFITVEDILYNGRQRFAELPRGISEETFRRQAKTIIQDEIRDAVNESLVYDEAQRRQPDDQKEQVDKEIEQTLADLIAEAGGSKAKLEQDMIEEGTTLQKVLEEQRRKIVSERFLRGRFAPAIHANRRMLWEYYQGHKDEFSTPKKVQMQLLSVTYRDFLGDNTSPSRAALQAAQRKAREQANAAVAAIRAGQPFTEVVKKYSTDARKDEGGLWPLMAAGSFRLVAVERAAFALQQGAVSDVIEDNGGYYIVKAVKVQPGMVQDFEQAQDKIENSIKRQQYRKLSDEYYQKLIKGAIIVQSDDFFDRCEDRAVKRFWRP